MFNELARSATKWLPETFRDELRSVQYGWQIKRGHFISEEPEFEQLKAWLRPGDTVLDIGANVGHYTLHFARLVGPTGRVISFEPMPQTFALLTRNVAKVRSGNVTLVNAAATDAHRTLRFNVPSWDWGAPNYYQARVDASGNSQVIGLPVDSVMPDSRVALIKIDVEGQEFACLQGARKLLERDHPILIVEGRESAVSELLGSLGYVGRYTNGSPNTVFEKR